MMVGPEMGQRPVYGGVEACGDQGVLEPVAFRDMIVDVVGGDQGDSSGLPGDSSQSTIAVRVPLEEVLLELHID